MWQAPVRPAILTCANVYQLDILADPCGSGAADPRDTGRAPWCKSACNERSGTRPTLIYKGKASLSKDIQPVIHPRCHSQGSTMGHNDPEAASSLARSSPGYKTDWQGHMSGKQAKKKRKQSRLYSVLEEHVRSGTTLTPPWLRLPNLQKTSWMNDRLPEFLWAALLVTQMERSAALEVFRSVARVGSHYRGIGKIPVTLSGIASMPQAARDAIIEAITADDTSRVALACLTAFKDLPARELWAARLGEPKPPLDWMPLMSGIARTLSHQSQESTDCQWASMYFRITSGQLKLPTDELNHQITDYPDFGDQRTVRPSIRATEVTMDNNYRIETGWSEKFWKQCLRETPCQSAPSRDTRISSEAVVSVEKVDRAIDRLVKHSGGSLQTTAVDPKHDTIFGTALYCLGILREVAEFSANGAIGGRMGLRAVLECYVTLAYLMKKNDEALWKSHRVYGAGQGKLAFLKIDEIEDASERPAYVSADTIGLLANEDQWQEYLPIDVGDWEKSDLRKRSEFAGVKADYDRYYSWTSAYVHGNWGAIRTSVLTTCFNPLHRLHRIPQRYPRPLGDVVPDLIYLVDKILTLVDTAYPPFEARLGT